VFKEIKIIFTRYDFDLLFPVGHVACFADKVVHIEYTRSERWSMVLKRSPLKSVLGVVYLVINGSELFSEVPH
jgi:hypothetical protein